MTRKRIAYLVTGLVVVVLLVWAFRPAPVPADFATVARGPLVVTIDEEGETRVRDRYLVSAPVPGRMQRIELEPGDPVRAKTTVLALFAPSPPAPLDERARAELQAQLRAAESGVGQARGERDRLRSELQFARSELSRTRNLFKGGGVSRERLEAAERQVQSLEHAFESAEFAVATAEHRLETVRATLQPAPADRAAVMQLRSPVDGVVLQRMQHSEAVVPAGTPLLEVGNVQNLEIVADLLSTEAVRVQPGQEVFIEQWGGERTLRGRVRRVEPAGFTKVSALGVEEQRVNVVIDLDEPEGVPLGHGYRVEVRVVVWSEDEVLKVPTGALFRREGQWYVFRAEKDRARLRQVEVGRRTGLEAQVLSGLEPGDRVIVFPSDAIEDGTPVTERTLR